MVTLSARGPPPYTWAMRIMAGLSFLVLTVATGCAAAPVGIEGPCPEPPEVSPMPQEGSEDTWFEETADRVAAYASELSGFDEKAAESCVATTDLVWRVVARDGEFFAVTMDYVPTRVNVVIERSIVTDTTAG